MSRHIEPDEVDPTLPPPALDVVNADTEARSSEKPLALAPYGILGGRQRLGLPRVASSA